MSVLMERQEASVRPQSGKEGAPGAGTFLRPHRTFNTDVSVDFVECGLSLRYNARPREGSLPTCLLRTPRRPHHLWAAADDHSQGPPCTGLPEPWRSCAPGAARSPIVAGRWRRLVPWCGCVKVCTSCCDSCEAVREVGSHCCPRPAGGDSPRAPPQESPGWAAAPQGTAAREGRQASAPARGVSQLSHKSDPQ